MFKIFKYSFIDMFRSKWNIIYFIFFLLVSQGMIYFSGNLAKSAAGLMNIILFLCSLIGVMFGSIYYYNSREFIQLLLAQPLKRSSIFIGHFLGMDISLIAAFVLGTIIPFTLNGIFSSEYAVNFIFLLISGAFLTSIFSSISYYISLKSENRLAGFGLSILTWLFMAVIYDGLFMAILIILDDYPLEKFSLVASMLNPIDITRIMIILKLDISALMGYTGAIFKQFFGSPFGISVSLSILLLWCLIPIYMIKRAAFRKDF